GNSANVVYTGSDGPRLLYRGITLEGISGIGFGHNGYSATLDEDPPVTPGFEDDEPDLFTEKEKREQLRRRRQGLVSQYAGKMHGQVNGDTIRQVNATLLQRFGKPVNQCNPEELERQIAWLEEQLGLNVADIEQAKQEPVIAETDEPDYVQFGLF
ncbi:MAG: hypothetical protein KDE53_39635, partial [Caldilineaceae bacterium]|nr:hypothetical protein [Caldilineaceae bacterium]